MKITGKTKLLALIGDPIVQARTPDLLNGLLAQQGLLGDYVVVPMQVSSNHLNDFVLGIRGMQNFAGAVITMPHKTAIVDLLDQLTPEAKLIGAVNVIKRQENGQLIGSILDGEGFVKGLMAVGHTIKNKTCFLNGSGGAASAIAFALAKYGCGSLVVHNRSHEKTIQLIGRLGQVHPEIILSTEVDHKTHFDMAINATSLGMKENDSLSISKNMISCSTLVAECVLAPEETLLLKTAKELGCKTHTGIAMLEAQLALMLEFMK